MRKTKIIATIGPATRKPEILESLVLAGLDCARLNFSHGTFDEHQEVITSLRRVSERHQRPLAILQDLGGVKMRLGRIKGTLHLNVGDVVSLLPEAASSSRDVLPFPQPGALKNLHKGNQIFISDGTICLEVLENVNGAVKAQVRHGGHVTSFKGVNLPGVDLEQSVLTRADEMAIKFGVENKVDWIAASFVGTAQDVRDVRKQIESNGGSIPVMAKLERTKAIQNLDSILKEVDGIMVARGDLGIEIPMSRVPIVQKEAVRKANEATCISVIATQMMTSMMASPQPTRAEISDIANAVLDGCDAIMLSDETAVGQFPVEVIQTADRAIQDAESIYPYYKNLVARDRTQAIARAAADLVSELNSQPIVLTSTGRAAREVSRFRPNANITVFSHNDAVLNRLCITWGLNPAGVIPPEKDTAQLLRHVIQAALRSGAVKESDVVTIVHGFLTGVTGTTNTIQVLDLREYLSTANQKSEAAQGAAR
jgi:pyruvate kinase